MKQTTFIISIFLTLNLFGQKSEIENFINQIVLHEVPENFEYYILVPESLEQPKIYDSLQNYQIKELGIPDIDFPLNPKKFPLNLIYNQSQETTNWKKFDLKKVRYVPDKYFYQESLPSKNVRFVKYNISQKKYDSLVENKKPYTLIVKKKWIWNKKRIWRNEKFHNELVKAWNKDKKINPEEQVHFQFSKPIFSKNKKYARISIFKNRRCKGKGFTALYKKENGIWKKLIEFNWYERQVISTHISCEETIAINYK